MSGVSQQFSPAGLQGLQATPVPLSSVVSGGDVHDVVDIIASAGLTIGLTKSGTVFSFGLNRYGQCGSPRYALLFFFYHLTLFL